MRKSLNFNTLNLLIAICFIIFSSSCRKDKVPHSASLEHILFELIPGSTYHDQNATWWGYNQQKIVRYEDKIFMAVINNDNLVNGYPNASNPSTAYIYCKTDQGNWVKGAGLPTSRPVNLLIDSQGILHVILFEPTEVDPMENGSLGRLKHYWFPHSSTGNIDTHLYEIIENHNQGEPESVNIRIGSTISSDNKMYVSFGINQDVKVYSKEENTSTWVEELAGQNLGNSYYYPFIATTSNGPCILAIQDDYVGPGLPAIYHKNKLFYRFNGSWINQTLLDLSTHPLAASRNRLADNCELFVTSDNRILGIYQSYLEPNIDWKATYTQIELAPSGNVISTPLNLESDEINRIRIIEHHGEIYYICIKYDKLFIKKGINGPLTLINTPSFTSGNYIYLSNRMNSANLNSNYIDILLLNGNVAEYPNAANYYVRIPTSQLAKL
ncbi:MAG: hypothetical protein ACK5F0_08610 [Flavobacteriales bacterium]|jgi:hypothetical protein